MYKDSGNLYDEIGPKWLHGVTIVGDHCDKDCMMLILNDGNDDDEDAADDGDDGGDDADDDDDDDGIDVDTRFGCMIAGVDAVVRIMARWCTVFLI